MLNINHNYIITSPLLTTLVVVLKSFKFVLINHKNIGKHVRTEIFCKYCLSKSNLNWNHIFPIKFIGLCIVSAQGEALRKSIREVLSPTQCTGMLSYFACWDTILFSQNNENIIDVLKKIMIKPKSETNSNFLLMLI